MSEEDGCVKQLHTDLSAFIKGVHRSLREQVKKTGDLESVWTAHCRNESGLLSSYAEAMRRLATDVWPRQHRVTRIDWCVNACQEYFLGTGLQRVREKARRRQIYSLVRGVRLPQDKQTATDCGCRDRHLCGNRDNMPSSSTGQQSFEGCDHSASSLLSAGDECADFMSLSDLPSVEEDRAESELVRSQTVFEEACQIMLPLECKIRLLDVGSCYDPFQQFDEFTVVAIDISPAVETVYKCDFLGVDIGAPLSSPSAVDAHFDSLLHMPTDERRSSGIIRFASESFHVVVFSLLLEYLPTSYQRVRCCQQAWRLLALDGLLVIVTPDSRRQHRNRRVAADWRRDIESIGFARWRYEKLEHVHCMAFRKVIGDGRRPLEPGMPSSVNPLRIPQDHDDDDGDEVAAVDGKTGDIEDSSQTIELFTDVYRELSAVDCCDV